MVRGRRRSVSVRLPERLFRRLERVVTGDPRVYNRSHLIEEALRAYLDLYDEDPDQLPEFREEKDPDEDDPIEE